MTDTEKDKKVGWIIWFVGLPGSGKSTYARAVYQALRGRGKDVRYLAMDERRRTYTPHPQYTSEERVRAYRLFAEEAADEARKGNNVIMDGSAPELKMREYARRLVPRFAEIYVRCPLETAMRRETARPEGRVMADLYKKAIERKNTGVGFEGLGEVIGVDQPFEENPSAECIIYSDEITIQGGRDRVLTFLSSWQAESADHH